MRPCARLCPDGLQRRAAKTSSQLRRSWELSGGTLEGAKNRTDEYMKMLEDWGVPAS